MNELQKKELEIFIEVKKVLERHGLTYFAIGGTCIGAVRHQGFIPWDDDIDIAMPREDYEKFRKEYYKELPDYLQKLDGDNCKIYNGLYMKIHDSRTTYIEQHFVDFPSRYSGVFIDVMPVDAIPADKVDFVIKKVKKLSHMNNVNRKPFRKSLSMSSKLKHCIFALIQITHKPDYYSNKIEKCLRQFDGENSDRALFTWRYKASINRKVYAKEMFDSVVEVPFENTTIAVPIGYDQYLKQDFGNYMKLPPKEQQKTLHNVYLLDLCNAFGYYADRKRRGENL
ncbi:LicD family protein [Butyrivibrio sp. YAB3001]|uniref:LicD family protein n=1 Tax=Butyrivibrio sp. YAB3001 TaxID=1520812 RepID=UPI0008F63AA1|nr:LicD family protein [Butyrivibrio sp. YAB3001]SFC80359.1 lipopolysaccharide cholinephosphotransferase [Butyrivibrio sp. YAB3001]